MSEKKKRDRLRNVPTRKLVESIKKDLRREIQKAERRVRKLKKK